MTYVFQNVAEAFEAYLASRLDSNHRAVQNDSHGRGHWKDCNACRNALVRWRLMFKSDFEAGWEYARMERG